MNELITKVEQWAKDKGLDQADPKAQFLKVAEEFVHAENFGPDRAASISPLGWAEELGLPFTLHQDTPVIQPDMLETVWCAVNRLTREGKTLGPALKVSPMAALRAVTLHAAYQYFREDTLGSIRPGKQADLIVLSADPTAVAPMDIRSIQVVETIHAGKTVWQA